MTLSMPPALSETARAALQARLDGLLVQRVEAFAEATSAGATGDAADRAGNVEAIIRLEELDARISGLREKLSAPVAPRARAATPCRSAAACPCASPARPSTEPFLVGVLEEAGGSVEVITPASPLGKALLGARSGDEIAYRAANGAPCPPPSSTSRADRPPLDRRGTPLATPRPLSEGPLCPPRTPRPPLPVGAVVAPGPRRRRAPRRPSGRRRSRRDRPPRSCPAPPRRLPLSCRCPGGDGHSGRRLRSSSACRRAGARAVRAGHHRAVPDPGRDAAATRWRAATCSAAAVPAAARPSPSACRWWPACSAAPAARASRAAWCSCRPASWPTRCSPSSRRSRRPPA